MKLWDHPRWSWIVFDLEEEQRDFGRHEQQAP